VPKEYLFLSPTQPLEFSMLGLGDIVVPGLFIALALRYDLYRFHLLAPERLYKRHMYQFPKPFFWATFAAYIAGLMLTMTVMHVFKTAQPALLYLSPSCAFAALITAVLRGELPSLWTYKEVSKEERLEKLEKEKKEEEGEEKEEKEAAVTAAEGDATKPQAMAIKKKVSGKHGSGHGGDVESLDDLLGEDGTQDSEWTQGVGDPDEVRP
jgi:minor histocompatibility antigen H13